LAKGFIEDQIPALVLRLYPPEVVKGIDLGYIGQVFNRLHVAFKLISLISDRVSEDLFPSNPSQDPWWAPKQDRMTRRLLPLVFTIGHFFEVFREEYLKYIRENGWGISRVSHLRNDIELDIMSAYDDDLLLRVHQVFPLVLSCFCLRLGQPVLAGSFESSVLRYMEESRREALVAAFCLGGLWQATKLCTSQDYRPLQKPLIDWFQSLKSNHKWEMLAETSHHTHFQLTPTPDPARNHVAEPHVKEEQILTRSGLSVGSPMPAVSEQDVAYLLPELPILDEIWLEEDKRQLLVRNVVRRHRDIKKVVRLLWTSLGTMEGGVTTRTVSI
jgi:hypothetical protein